VSELRAVASPPSRKLAAAAELAARAKAGPALRRELFDVVLPDPALHVEKHAGLTVGRILLAELLQADRAMVAAELPALLKKLDGMGISTGTWTASALWTASHASKPPLSATRSPSPRSRSPAHRRRLRGEEGEGTGQRRRRTGSTPARPD
jgi:hypothetical protein